MGKVCVVEQVRKFGIGEKWCVHVKVASRENSPRSPKTYFQRVEDVLMDSRWDVAILLLPTNEDAISGKVAVGSWLAARGIKTKMKYTYNMLVIEKVML